MNYVATRLLSLPGGTSASQPRSAVRGLVAPVTLFIAALVLSALLSLAGEIFLSRVTHAAEEQALARATAAAGSVGQLLRRTLDGVAAMHQLVQDRQAALAAQDLHMARGIEQHLARQVAMNHLGAVQAALIDADGRLAWSTVPGSQRVRLDDREHFRVHRDGGRGELFVSRPVLGRTSGRTTVQFTRPVLDAEGGFAGVAVVSVEAAALSRALGELRFGETDTVAVLRATDGAAVARHDGAGAEAVAAAAPPRPGGPTAEDCARVLGIAAGPGEGAFRGACPCLGRREALIGVQALEGTPLIAVFAMDAERELAALGRTVRLVQATTMALVLLLFTAAALAVLVPERQRARAALAWETHRRALAEASEREFTDMTAALPGAIYRGLVGADGALRPLHVGASLERVTGWRWDEAQGEAAPWHALVDGGTRAALRGFLAGVAHRGADSLEYRLRRPDGVLIWVRETARVVRRHPSEAEIVGYVEDITAGREVAAQAMAASKLATLGQMATSLAHELNQPIAVMSLAAQNALARLRAGGAAAIPDALARLERIAAQADRATEVTEQLRVFGHAGGHARTEPVALAEAVRGAMLLAGGALAAGGVRVVLRVPEDLPRVRARLVPLEQVIVNLLLNARDAVQAREAGRREVVLEATAAAGEAPPGGVVMRVSDTGGGIPAEVLGRVFEPFFTTKPVGRGTGLGLSFCFGTMASFGGGIAVRNAAAGAEFTLAFAAALPAEAAGPAAAEDGATAA